MAYSSRRLLPQSLQDSFIKLLSPPVKLFSKWGLSPNSFTVAGVIITSIGAAAFLLGFIRLAGILILLGGLCDTIDGLLARNTGKASRFGALLDSSVDRYAEFIMFFGKDTLTFFTLSFRARLQVFFISTIAVTIFMIALITTYYAENNNQERLKAQLNEKTYSVLIELQHKLGGIRSLDEVKIDELYPLLRKFSLVFFSDINVYNPSGKLIATSRPEIFRKGLLSELINPLAFEEIYVDNKLFYTTEEKIGKLSYYSSYVPLNLGESEPLGIVNLPYFARQTEVKKSYYLMIFTFLNLFVIAGIIGTFIALLLSKFLTKPLVVLQQSLSKIRIDEQNERIDWNNNDEIGLLIREYNQLVDKIEQSAELLKHSERESSTK